MNVGFTSQKSVDLLMFVDPYHDFLRHGHTYVHFDAPVDEPTGQQKSATFWLTYPVKITLMFILNAFPLNWGNFAPRERTNLGEGGGGAQWR